MLTPSGMGKVSSPSSARGAELQKIISIVVMEVLPTTFTSTRKVVSLTRAESAPDTFIMGCWAWQKRAASTDTTSAAGFIVLIRVWFDKEIIKTAILHKALKNNLRKVEEMLKISYELW